jgi:hypothetical protein
MRGLTMQVKRGDSRVSGVAGRQGRGTTDRKTLRGGLGEVLAQVSQRAVYARRIDYTLPVPPPPLRPAMRRWLAAHLALPQAPTDQ